METDTMERVLAACLLALVLATAFLEQRSPAAAAVRAGHPWACLVALDSAETALPRLYLALYQPARRTLDLIHVPETADLPGGGTPAKAHALARRDGADEEGAAKAMADAAEPLFRDVLPPGQSFAFHHDSLPETQEGLDEEAPTAARLWLAEEARGPGFWRSVLTRWRRPARPGLGAMELFRMGRETHSLPDDGLRASWLPDPDRRAEFFGRLLSGKTGSDDGRAVTVEVLNSSGRKGLAESAKKVLRSRGADVMSTGNAPARWRTTVYDRTGRPELAANVRRMLGCRSAEAVTQIDAKRLVDVSVVIADDCF